MGTTQATASEKKKTPRKVNKGAQLPHSGHWPQMGSTRHRPTLTHPSMHTHNHPPTQTPTQTCFKRGGGPQKPRDRSARQFLTIAKMCALRFRHLKSANVQCAAQCKMVVDLRLPCAICPLVDFRAPVPLCILVVQGTGRSTARTESLEGAMTPDKASVLIGTACHPTTRCWHLCT